MTIVAAPSKASNMSNSDQFVELQLLLHLVSIYDFELQTWKDKEIYYIMFSRQHQNFSKIFFFLNTTCYLK